MCRVSGAPALPPSCPPALPSARPSSKTRTRETASSNQALLRTPHKELCYSKPGERRGDLCPRRRAREAPSAPNAPGSAPERPNITMERCNCGMSAMSSPPGCRRPERTTNLLRPVWLVTSVALERWDNDYHAYIYNPSGFVCVPLRLVPTCSGDVSTKSGLIRVGPGGESNEFGSSNDLEHLLPGHHLDSRFDYAIALPRPMDPTSSTTPTPGL